VHSKFLLLEGYHRLEYTGHARMNKIPILFIFPIAGGLKDGIQGIVAIKATS
jgi:hypothetical protein